MPQKEIKVEETDWGRKRENIELEPCKFFIYEVSRQGELDVLRTEGHQTGALVVDSWGVLGIFD